MEEVENIPDASLPDKVKGVAEATVDTIARAVQGKQVIAKKTKAERRMDVCAGTESTKPCTYFKPEGKICRICGCMMKFKTKQENAKCPTNKW